ncbi:MAG: MarR family transcriptional regulator [Planctomycetota bacterium]
MAKHCAERPIDRELRQPTHGCLSHPATRTVLSLMRTADRIEHVFGGLLRERDLTLSQYEVLRILRDSGRKLTVVELTGFMVHETPAMTGLIDRLEADGLVERERSVEDRRMVYVKLCRKGKALVDRLDQPVADLHAEFVAGLSQKEQTALEALLLKVRDAFLITTD